MAKPAETIRNQAQEIWPGAIVAERGKGHIKHMHPDDFAAGKQPDDPGTRMMFDTQTGAKWHYGAEPYTEASEIDTAWVASAGAWDWEVTKNDFHSYIRDSVPVSYRYEDVATGHWIELTVTDIQWVNDAGQSENAASFSQVTPVINDDEITWNNIAPGWHVMVRAEVARLAKWLTIDSLADLGSPTIGGTNIQLRFLFTYQRSAGLEIWADGAKWDEKNNTWFETTNPIEFRDASTQQPVFYFKQPIGFDVDGNNAAMSHRVRRLGVNFYAEIDTPWSWLQTAIYPIQLDDTVNKDIASSGDDGYIQGTNYRPTNDPCSFGGFGGSTRQDAWFRWVGVTISGTINNATITWEAALGDSDTPCELRISGDDQDDPGQIASTADYDGRTITTNYVDWTFPTWAYDATQATPNLSTVIQELVNSYTFSSSALQLFVKGRSFNANRRVRHYDNHAATQTAALYIEYTAGAAGLSVNISPGANYVQIV